MSDSLTPLLADNRSALVTDLVGVIDAEVADQSGLSGAAVKTAYAAVQKVKPNVVPVSYTHLTLPTNREV